MSALKKSPRTKSDKSDKRTKHGRPPRRSRQNDSDMPVMDIPLTDRKSLLELRSWVLEIHETRTYRWIAAHTWRGDKAFGYFQSIGDGKHLVKNPHIRPRIQDWHDLNLLCRTLRDFSETDSALFDAALRVVETRAAMDSSVAHLLQIARKRTGVRNE